MLSVGLQSSENVRGIALHERYERALQLRERNVAASHRSEELSHDRTGRLSEGQSLDRLRRGYHPLDLRALFSIIERAIATGYVLNAS